MLQSKGLNGTAFGNNKHKSDNGRRHRSKSEGYELHSTPDYLNEVLKSDGMAIKSSKDKAHDRKPRNFKGRGQPKKGKAYSKVRSIVFFLNLTSNPCNLILSMKAAEVR